MKDYNSYEFTDPDNNSFYSGVGVDLTEVQLKQPSNSYAFLLVFPDSLNPIDDAKYQLNSYCVRSNGLYCRAMNKIDASLFQKDSIFGAQYSKILINYLLNELDYGDVMYSEFIVYTLYDNKSKLMYFLRRSTKLGSVGEMQSDYIPRDINLHSPDVFNNYSLKAKFCSIGNQIEMNSWLYVFYNYSTEFYENNEGNIKSITLKFEILSRQYISDVKPSYSNIYKYFYPEKDAKIYLSTIDYVKRIGKDGNQFLFLCYGKKFEDVNTCHFMLLTVVNNNITNEGSWALYYNIPYEVSEGSGLNMWISPNFKWIFFVKNGTDLYGKGLTIIRGNEALIDFNGWLNKTYYKNDTYAIDIISAVSNKYVLDIIFNKTGNKMIILCNSQVGRFSTTNFSGNYYQGIQPDYMYCFTLTKSKWQQLNLNGIGLSELWNNYDKSGTEGMGYRPVISFDYNTANSTTGISYVYPAHNLKTKAYYAQLTFGD